MKLNVLNAGQLKLKLNEELEYICALVDIKLGELQGYLNLVYCDDKTICQLNKKHRKQDKVTDVLTFTYYQGKTTDSDLLGEIIIDIQQAELQAEEVKNKLQQEVYKLFIHGLLHLRGYDHQKDEDYRVMKLIEDEIMNSFLESNFF